MRAPRTPTGTARRGRARCCCCCSSPWCPRCCAPPRAGSAARDDVQTVAKPAAKDRTRMTLELPRTMPPRPELSRLSLPEPSAADAPGTTPRSSAISTRGFSLFYGARQALKSVNLEIAERNVTAIIGPSGCGKSTLLRSFNRMNDLIPGVRVEGQVRLGTLEVFAPSTDVVELRRRVGMVFQRPNPFPKSIFDNVAFGLRMLGIRDAAELEWRVEQ